MAFAALTILPWVAFVTWPPFSRCLAPRRVNFRIRCGSAILGAAVAELDGRVGFVPPANLSDQISRVHCVVLAARI